MAKRTEHTRPEHAIRIPLKTDEAIAGLLAVKPNAEMPRPGAQPTGQKKPKGKHKPSR